MILAIKSLAVCGLGGNGDATMSRSIRGTKSSGTKSRPDMFAATLERMLKNLLDTQASMAGSLDNFRMQLRAIEITLKCVSETIRHELGSPEKTETGDSTCVPPATVVGLQP